MPTMMLDNDDKDAIGAKIDSVHTFLVETDASAITNQDVKDMVSDLLDMINLIVFGTPVVP